MQYDILSIVWEHRGIVCRLNKTTTENLYAISIDEHPPIYFPLESSLLDLMNYANKIIDAYLG